MAIERHEKISAPLLGRISFLLEQWSLKEKTEEHSHIRIHMSKNPVESVRSAKPQEIGFKPSGFWYGCGLEWLDFAENEFPEAKGNYLYSVTLNPSADILFIRNLAGLDAFHEKYIVPDPHSTHVVLVDWPRVAKEYDGIEICPYQWTRRLAKNFLWYYGWDVASGCVWNPRAIQGLEPIERKDAKESRGPAAPARGREMVKAG